MGDFYMKKVSIIMPAYNAEKTINKSINSILKQDYENIELIVLNDGSKDRTKDIIKSFKDKRLIHIEKNNSGVGDTRNRGLEVSTGDYIMFVDSDDYIEKDCISKLVKVLEKNDCDLVICDYYIETSSETIEIHFGYSEPTNLKESKELITKINLAPWNKIYKKELFRNKDNRFSVNLKYEDVPFVIQAIIDAKKIGFVPECLFHYVLTKNSETFTRNKRIFDILKICNIIEDKLKIYNYIAKTELIVRILSYYLKNSRFLRDKTLRNDLIDAIFDYLNNLDKNWKKCSIIKANSFIKRTIITNKSLLKLTGCIYNLKK